ncbi:MAG: SMI1/KNR4 family protein [Oscillospiraceae bacterium]|nr:SMI1/KNR4 family protein [Oscillospiraceae bacterium]
MNILEIFSQYMLANNWIVEHKTNEFEIGNHSILKQYCNLSCIELYIDFLKNFSKIESYDSCTWFLCEEDYRRNYKTNEFSWNEFEKISIAYAIDESEQKYIKKWWSWHLPIAISVKNKYCYLAIDLKDNFGSIIYGEEPEFEIESIIAPDFETLLKLIIDGKLQWI